MTITAEQRTYARLAGILVFVNYVFQGIGDYVTIMSRRSESFADTARFAAESVLLWRVSLLQVAIAWLATAVMAFALYVVFEPVNKRLAQLALLFRLGSSFLGAAGIMLRVAQARLYQASATEGLFTAEQLRTLASVCSRANGAGFCVSMILLGMGSTLFFVLFLRSRYLPRALAGIGTFSYPLLTVMGVVMFVVPEWTNELKLFGVPALLVELAMALWLLIKGLPQRPREYQIEPGVS